MQIDLCHAGKQEHNCYIHGKELICVPGHEGVVSREKVDQLARTGSERQFIGPEPACGISIGVAKKAVRDWANRNNEKHWEFTTGLKQAKRLIY
jgi:hypothetical protein